MEKRAHDVMIVPSEDRNTGSALPVPDADRLVVRRAQNPWVFMVEHGRPDVIHVAKQGEQTTPLLVIPDLIGKQNQGKKISTSSTI